MNEAIMLDGRDSKFSPPKFFNLRRGLIAFLLFISFYTCYLPITGISDFITEHFVTNFSDESALSLLSFRLRDLLSCLLQIIALSFLWRLSNKIGKIYCFLMSLGIILNMIFIGLRTLYDMNYSSVVWQVDFLRPLIIIPYFLAYLVLSRVDAKYSRATLSIIFYFYLICGFFPLLPPAHSSEAVFSFFGILNSINMIVLSILLPLILFANKKIYAGYEIDESQYSYTKLIRSSDYVGEICATLLVIFIGNFIYLF